MDIQSDVVYLYQTLGARGCHIHGLAGLQFLSNTALALHSMTQFIGYHANIFGNQRNKVIMQPLQRVLGFQSQYVELI